jgi:hypothetical protein
MPAHTRRFKTIFWFKFQNNVQNTTAPSLYRPKEEEPTVVVTRFFFLSSFSLLSFFCDPGFGFAGRKKRSKKKGCGVFPLLLPEPPSIVPTSALSQDTKGEM